MRFLEFPDSGSFFIGRCWSFPFIGICSISSLSMSLFNSSTLDDGCGVSWVISSGCEFGVRVVWSFSIFVFIDSFIDSFILLLILAANYCMNSFMLSFINYLMSTMMASLRYFII